MLQGENRNLLARIGKLEGERDKLLIENEELTHQCSDMNSALGSGARLNEIWRKSMSHHWEQVCVPGYVSVLGFQYDIVDFIYLFMWAYVVCGYTRGN